MLPGRMSQQGRCVCSCLCDEIGLQIPPIQISLGTNYRYLKNNQQVPRWINPLVQEFCAMAPYLLIWGPGHVTINEILHMNIEQSHLIQKTANLVVLSPFLVQLQLVMYSMLSTCNGDLVITACRFSFYPLIILAPPYMHCLFVCPAFILLVTAQDKCRVSLSRKGPKMTSQLLPMLRRSTLGQMKALLLVSQKT